MIGRTSPKEIAINKANRVLHVAPGEPFGGVQRIVLNLVAAQVEDNRVGVLWTGEADQAISLSPRDGVEVMHANGSLIRRFAAAHCALKAFKADIVHLHMPPPWIAPTLTMKQGTVCYHLHGAPHQGVGLKAQLASLLERWMISRADVMIAISFWIEGEWRKLYPKARYRRVFNGIPVGSSAGKIRSFDAANPPVIGFASRLAPDKGVGEFATFLLALHEKLPRARFLVAGEGPERALLEQRLGSLIAAGYVELAGHVSDMPSFWSRLDLAIFSAPADAFGLCLIEPVAEGVPVIAYETGTGSDEIANNCRGILTVPYEKTESMADLAVELLADPERREALGRKGMADVEHHFSIAAMTKGIDAVYEEVLDVNFKGTI